MGIGWWRHGDELDISGIQCYLLKAESTVAQGFSTLEKTGLEYSTVPRAWQRVSERASERMSAAERASEVSSAEQANE